MLLKKGERRVEFAGTGFEVINKEWCLLSSGLPVNGPGGNLRLRNGTCVAVAAFQALDVCHNSSSFIAAFYS